MSHLFILNMQGHELYYDHTSKELPGFPTGKVSDAELYGALPALETL